MQTHPTHPTEPTGVDPEELDRHIAEMYRDVANEAEGVFTSRPADRLRRRSATPPNCSTGCRPTLSSSFAGVGYHFGLARLLPGERVLDLGSGSGMDVFAAAVQVGPHGSVIGVDITPEQLAKPSAWRATNTSASAARGSRSCPSRTARSTS